MGEIDFLDWLIGNGDHWSQRLRSLQPSKSLLTEPAKRRDIAGGVPWGRLKDPQRRDTPFRGEGAAIEHINLTIGIIDLTYRSENSIVKLMPFSGGSR
jgi:hypothetical protein